MSNDRYRNITVRVHVEVADRLLLHIANYPLHLSINERLDSAVEEALVVLLNKYKVPYPDTPEDTLNKAAFEAAMKAYADVIGMKVNV